MSRALASLFQQGLDAAATADSGEIGAHMKALAWQVPFLQQTARADLPTIILFRSLRYAYVRNAPDGFGKLKIPDGHFSTRAFLKSVPAQRIFANVLGDNLNQAPAIAPVNVAINTISCPDLHGPDLLALSRFLARQRDLPVINPPDRIQGTGRSDMAERLRGVPGLHVPRTVRLVLPRNAPAACAERALGSFRPPIILRVAGAHTGRTVVLARDNSDLRSILTHFGPGSTIYATEFVDARGGEVLSTKYRAFFIDGRLYPVARLVSNTWNVHSGDRYRVMFALPDAQQLERAYIADPEQQLGQRAIQALQDIQRRVRLDFFGIDFAQMPSGELLIFEVNAVMRHNYDHARTFPYTRPNLDRISGAFDKMVLERIASASSLRD